MADALTEAKAAQAELHKSTYWPAALRQKGANHLWQTDVHLVATIAALAPPPSPPPPPTGTVVDCFPGQWASVLAQAKAGQTIQLRGGVHRQIVFDRAFPAYDRLTVRCDPDTLVKGFHWLAGSGGYILDSVYGQLLPADVGSLDDIGPRVFNLDGVVRDVRILRSKAEGGNTTFYPYCGSGWITNIELLDSELWGAWGDLCHAVGVDGLVIDHNVIRDPRHLTAEHHDGFQPERTQNWQFTRNTVSWLNGEGHYVGKTANYLGQGIMLSGAGSNGPVNNGLIANNLIHHYNGRPLNMNGVNGLKVVNNTMVNSGDDADFSYGGGAGVEVWNNIFDGTWNDVAPSVPAFFDSNWISLDSGNLKGTNHWAGDPGFVDRTLYQLTASSPARGKGLQRPGTPAVDLDGQPRTGLVLGCRV